MATLQKIRNKAVLLTIIIGLALFAFIIGDFLNSGSSLLRQSQETIAEIGDYSLDYKEYEARIKEMQDVYAIQTGQDNLDDATMGQLRESVFQTLVREKLIQQQAEELGLTVTGKEIFSLMNGVNIHPMIMQLPIFRNQQTGQFDRSVMMNFLQTIQTEDFSNYDAQGQEQIMKFKAYWLFWENNLKFSRLEEKINALLSKAVQANALDVEFNYANSSEQIDFAYVMKPYTTLADSLFSISMGDIKKRYAEKKEAFYQEPYRSATYVQVNIDASQEDFAAVESKINSFREPFTTTEEPMAFAGSNSDDVVYDCYVANSMYDEDMKALLASTNGFMEPTFKNGLYRMARVLGRKVAPDSVKARLIVLPLDDVKRADSIAAALKGGADFDALVARYNSGSSAEMGWFREMDAIDMGDAFLSACFSATKNAYFTVKTKYDIRVMQVTDMSKPVAKSRMALISLKLTPSSNTYSIKYNELNRIVAEHQNAADFFKAAKAAGYTVLEAPIVRATDFTLGGIPQMRQAVRFVFTNEVGKLSTLLENNNNQFVVVGVTDTNDDTYQSVKKVKAQLEKELINEKKGDKLVKEVAAKGYTTLAQCATAEGFLVDTVKFYDFSMPTLSGLGDEPALMAAAVKAEPNKVLGPIKGKNGVFMIQVVAKRNSQAIFNPAFLKQSWNYNKMYLISYQGFDAVKKASKVEDNRIRMY